MIWVERKFIAKIQLRVGPQYAGRFGGILQNFADLFKLLFKEIIVPDKADKAVFLVVPLALMFVSGALLALVPRRPHELHRRPLGRRPLRLRAHRLQPDNRAARRLGEQQQVLAPRRAAGRCTRWWPTRSR